MAMGCYVGLDENDDCIWVCFVRGAGWHGYILDIDWSMVMIDG